jgi:cell division septation protein DedD
MPKIEPVYEPRGHDAFDGGEDDLEQEDDGSRLPLLIVIALLVLVAFGGVVWLAYQHGVERGMLNAPREVVAQDNQGPAQNYDKIYQKPAASDDDTANDNTAPPPPAPALKSVATPSPKPVAPAVTRAAAKTVMAAPLAAATIKPPATTTKPPAVATKAPANLVSRTALPKTVDTTPLPSTPAPSTPAPSTSTPGTPAASAASGDFVLQIGSYKSQDEAEASWSAYKAHHPLAGSRSDSIARVDLGAKGIWYRLRIDGFESKDAAAAFCLKLRAAGGACLLAKR